jgi:uncharacterized protein YecE (DUF72 family)
MARGLDRRPLFRGRIHRTKELDGWAEKIQAFAARGLEVFVFANNHPTRCRRVALAAPSLFDR